MKRLARRITLAVLALAGAGAIGYALIPAPVPVETQAVGRGALRVTVDEDGRTRIKERYLVSAPLAGRLARVTLDPGDEVRAGETLLAALDPGDPALLDPRARAEAEARVRAAEAALEQARTALGRADAALELAQTELVRVRAARESGATTPRELDHAALTVTMREREREAAGFAREIARFELDLAKAAVVRTEARADGEPDAWRMEIRAPVSGRVLRVLQESAAVVQAGAPLVEVGDPADLEVVVDVLSTDAVAIRPGSPVVLERWGGQEELNGVVRLIEPSAFTKVSALGVEEQRVNVVIDLNGAPEARRGLGDGFRVEARIVTWEGADVLKVATGALFRHAGSWAVYALQEGRATRRDVTIGRRNSLEAQVLSGLGEGDVVIVYPGDRVRDGVRVAPRGP